MHRWASDEPNTAAHPPLEQSHSGVRAPRGASSPPPEQLHSALVGSLPIDAIGIEFQPIVDLEIGKTVAYEVMPGLRGDDGSIDAPALLAHAAHERSFAALGRAIRSLAVREGAGKLLYIPLHPAELHERLIVQPDDPIFSYEAGVRLQLSQPVLSTLARHVLDELRSRCGAELVLDDFGGGPATLKQLVELEPYAVKLDRELISGIDRHFRKQVIVRGTTDICRSLDARVIAKGVDCEAEAIAARECGVRYAQGYVVGEPAPLPAISIWPTG